MSKAYLHHSFVYGHERTYSVVHVLLAVLYYKSGHYQAAIAHCKQVLNQTSREQYGVRSIGAKYLPQIDESVDAILGLILCYQYIERNALKSADQLESNNADLAAFTPKLLAHYLCSKCSTVVDAEGREDLTMYRQHLFHTRRLFVSDVLLFKTIETQLNKYTVMPFIEVSADDDGNSTSSSMDNSLLVTTLELVALEKLITYRQMMVRERHSDQFPVWNEFEALYAYKCGLFEECLEMCQRYLDTSLHRDCSKDHLPVGFPEMLTLLDGELVSFVGIIGLVSPLPLFVSLVQRSHSLRIFMRTLSLYLMVQCQKKLSIDLHDALQLIQLVHNATDEHFVLDRLLLKVIYRSLKMSINNLVIK